MSRELFSKFLKISDLMHTFLWSIKTLFKDCFRILVEQCFVFIHIFTSFSNASFSLRGLEKCCYSATLEVSDERNCILLNWFWLMWCRDTFSHWLHLDQLLGIYHLLSIVKKIYGRYAINMTLFTMYQIIWWLILI